MLNRRALAATALAVAVATAGCVGPFASRQGAANRSATAQTTAAKSNGGKKRALAQDKGKGKSARSEPTATPGAAQSSAPAAGG